MEIPHFSHNASSEEVAEALYRAGCAIVEQLINKDHMEALHVNK
jgi:hypothetical protein